MKLAQVMLVASLTLVVSAQISAFDFMERPAAILLAPEPDRFAVGRGGFAQSAYHANVFVDTEIDRFQVGAYGHHGILDVPRARLGMYYGTTMLNGAVNPGDSPGAEAAQWMMNAIQFEYGFVGAWEVAPGWPARAAVVAEYSRRSYHPLRSGFEQPAADVLRAGIVVRDVPGRRLERLTTDWAARISWSELYEFWGAPKIAQPRALYTLHLALESTATTGLPGVQLFFLGMPDVILLREGGVNTDLALQSGVRLGPGGRLELFLDYYRSADTEQLSSPSPAELFGYGIRFVLESR